ncbi:hypothetical protein M413DRAFT_21417 [Hebeloma cylindrosporum]|uniref:Uncharacterized protein n=1 Tax=Hebeloma cylindrosporum TaxID=76867 RepID=A0A0C3CZ97_HEBCY|nr:hypothetical protein M413DRAFT_21417 [Hebeloma cylindrosporum h7]
MSIDVALNVRRLAGNTGNFPNKSFEGWTGCAPTAKLPKTASRNNNSSSSNNNNKVKEGTEGSERQTCHDRGACGTPITS